MTLKTDKSRDEYRLEFALAQLRHAYQQMTTADAENWTQRKRLMFANGLLAPVIRELERHMRGEQESQVGGNG